MALRHPITGPRDHPLGLTSHPNWPAAERKLLELRAARRRLLFPAPRRSIVARLRAWLSAIGW